MRNNMKVAYPAVILMVFSFFLWRTLFLRRKLILYLQKNFPSSFERLFPVYAPRDILIGNPDVFLALLRREQNLFNKQVRLDDKLISIQQKIKRSILLYRAQKVIAY
jgi:hypothetical protein